jgi:3-isopropylmalate/(R)-2-methylmalate dehydratase small subunit/methanogen homoaconitase small subunit
MRIEGTSIVLGDNVNTDLLHPPAFYSTDAAVAAAGAFGGLGVDLEGLGRGPYVIVAGRNFGCGSTRESTMRALREAGVAAVVARAFAHSFFRSAANVGLWPLVLAGEAAPELATGERVVVDTERSVLVPAGRGAVELVPLEPYIERIVSAGGLVPYLEARGWQWVK